MFAWMEERLVTNIVTHEENDFLRYSESVPERAFSPLLTAFFFLSNILFSLVSGELYKGSKPKQGCIMQYLVGSQVFCLK